MKSICDTCHGLRKHNVLHEKSINLHYHDDGWWEDHIYQIIQCGGCENISFRKLYNDIAREQGVEHGDLEPWEQELYPKRTLQSLAIRKLMNTPQNIKKIYRETIDGFNNDQTILCSGGLRAIIEGICKDRGIQEGTVKTKEGGTKTSRGLDGKIEGLAANGFLTNGNAEILHELRFLGNKALHELSSPSSEELKMAIEIVEHTLDNIYELQHKAAKLRAAIVKRKK